MEGGGVFVEGKLKVSSSFLGFQLFLVLIKLWSVCIYSFLFLWIYLVFSTIILLKMLLQVHLYNLVCYAFTCVKKKRFIYTWIFHTSSRLNKPHWENFIWKTTIFLWKTDRTTVLWPVVLLTLDLLICALVYFN